MQVRSGEQDKTWFRTDRFLRAENGWYFLTREQTQEGPFDTRREAEAELNYYIRHMTELSNFQSTG